jgi:hypothetical protein
MEARRGARWWECCKDPVVLAAFLASPRDHDTVLSHAPRG